MDAVLAQAVGKQTTANRWERVAVMVLVVAAPCLLLLNLDANPRPWHDEGSYLAVAKTLVQDGVYAVRSGEGYQTFGPVQSVGPTVLLPIALSFKLFGVGLLQARMVTALMALLTLGLYFVVGEVLFGRRAAIIAVVLLLASPGVGFLIYARPAFGEVPALGFFLGSWLAWVKGLGGGWRWQVLAGLLLGGAMVTKSQYVLLGGGALALMVVADLFYYRRGDYRGLLVMGVTGLLCVAGWWLWQVAYYGPATIQENTAKMCQLAAITTGFRLGTFFGSIKALLGPDSGYFHYYWGFPALVYAGLLALRKREGPALAFLWLFACLWLAYYTLWMIPWSRYLMPAAAITALFVGKLGSDLVEGVVSMKGALSNEFGRSSSLSPNLSLSTLMSLGTVMALLTLGLLTGHQLQRTVRADVLDRVGYEVDHPVSPPQFASPHLLAAFLNETVDREVVIETWERELAIFTDHRYHFPDQSLLAAADAFIYQGGPRDYALGAEYFGNVRPAYVIVGWYARFNQIYDNAYLAQSARLIETIGEGAWRYDVYALDLW